MSQNLQQILEGARLIGAGAATIGVIGAGIGIVLYLVVIFYQLQEIQA